MNDTTTANRNDDKKKKLYAALIESLDLYISAKESVTACVDGS